MAVVNGDILRFTTFITIQDQTVLNVDYRRYVDVGGSGNGYVGIAGQFRLVYTQKVMNSVSANAELFRVFLENMTNGLEFFDFATSDFGGQIGSLAALNNAIGVTQLRETKLTRNGSKRIGPMVEEDISGNDNLIGPTRKAELEDFYGQPQVLGGGASNDFLLTPVIVGRTLVDGVYVPDLTKVNEVTGAFMSPIISSQNSRKSK